MEIKMTRRVRLTFSFYVGQDPGRHSVLGHSARYHHPVEQPRRQEARLRSGRSQDSGCEESDQRQRLNSAGGCEDIGKLCKPCHHPEIKGPAGLSV